MTDREHIHTCRYISRDGGVHYHCQCWCHDDELQIAEPCPIVSSITGQPCLLPKGHGQWSIDRFHRHQPPTAKPVFPNMAPVDLDAHDREVENRLVLRMKDAIASDDLASAVPNSALEHVYDKVFTHLMTLADRARKEEAARP